MQTSSENERNLKRIAVIGGGITGLAAAFEASQHESQPQVTLFEASTRLGGVIRTVQDDDLVMELGPDMFTTREPFAIDLCRQLGISDHLLSTRRENRGAMIVRNGRLHPVPEGLALMAPSRIGPLLKSPLLSIAGKARLFGETIVRRSRGGRDESLESFACRRFGREAYTWLIQPLISGIYTADPTTLSMNATMKEFVDTERKQGSIVRASLRKRRRQKKENRSASSDDSASGARYGLFVAPQFGMEAIVRAIEQRLTTVEIRKSSQVEQLTFDPVSSHWIVHCGDSVDRFDRIILALHAYDAANLIREAHHELAHELTSIPYASTAVVVLVVPRDAIARAVNAFGIVVPLAEKRRVIAVSFANHKFDGRAASDWTVIRVFVGGACQAELLNHDDDALIDICRDELAELIELDRSVSPRCQHVARWNRRMPQYVLGHLDRVERIESLTQELAGLELAGNAYRGVGIPACIESGRSAARRCFE